MFAVRLSREFCTLSRPQVFAFGKGYLGCTGLDTRIDVEEPVPVPALAEVGARSLSAGWGHSAFVTNGGEPLVAGLYDDFEKTRSVIKMQQRWLGPIASFMNLISDKLWMTELVPQLAFDPPSADQPFVEAACSPGAVTAFLTASGKVFCVGSNDCGQCGVDSRIFTVREPVPVDGLDGVTINQVRLGFHHGIACSDTGKVFTWGRGNRGQLGRPSSETSSCAQSVSLPSPASRVSAGFAFSAAVTVTGEAYLWGKMQSVDASPDGDVMADQHSPRQVQPPPNAKFVDVTCGHMHASFLADDGSVWMTGLRGRGAMYDATGAEMDDFALKVADLNTRFSGAALMQVQPVQVKFGAPFTVQQVKKLASGVDHSYAVLEDGSVIHWGWRLVGVPYPKVGGLRVEDIAVGFAHTLLLARKS